MEVGRVGVEDENELSKELGEYEPRKPISKEVREARKVLREADAKLAMTEHANAAKAFDKNRERLKADGWLVRLASHPRRRRRKRRG